MEIILDNSFNVEQKNIINDCINKAKLLFNVNDNINRLVIKNNNRLATCAGMAKTSLREKEGVILMNKRLFNTTAGNEEFSNTFSHELAHIIANLLVGRSCGHDSYWKSIHKSLGGNGKDRHNYKIDHLKPKVKRHVYTCNCRIHKVSTLVHNKIKKGSKYSCDICKSNITYQSSFIKAVI